jgi:hypothetical protein
MENLNKGIVYSISNNGILVVGSSYPGGGEATKGCAVRTLKTYVSWVSEISTEPSVIN